MDSQDIRVVVGGMYRNQKITIPHPLTTIEVEFTASGEFVISLTNKTNTIGSGFRTESLKKAVKYIAPLFFPKVGDCYRHINGNVYQVLHIANELSERPDYPPSVVYQGATNRLIWVKPLSNFLKKMTRVK